MVSWPGGVELGWMASSPGPTAHLPSLGMVSGRLNLGNGDIYRNVKWDPLKLGWKVRHMICQKNPNLPLLACDPFLTHFNSGVYH